MTRENKIWVVIETYHECGEWVEGFTSRFEADELCEVLNRATSNTELIVRDGYTWRSRSCHVEEKTLDRQVPIFGGQYLYEVYMTYEGDLHPHPDVLDETVQVPGVHFPARYRIDALRAMSLHIHEAGVSEEGDREWPDYFEMGVIADSEEQAVERAQHYRKALISMGWKKYKDQDDEYDFEGYIKLRKLFPYLSVEAVVAMAKSRGSVP